MTRVWAFDSNEDIVNCLRRIADEIEKSEETEEED